MKIIAIVISTFYSVSCSDDKNSQVKGPVSEINSPFISQGDTGLINNEYDTIIPNSKTAFKIDTRDVTPEELVPFAKSLIGVPYLYASTNPKKGFDCSGFITYVFNHFNVEVPRSSVQFTQVGQQVDPTEAKPGDLILFTGTNPSIRVVGHMGIITSGKGEEIEFIHSTSGKANGVTISSLTPHYIKRFVKVNRVFKFNNY